MPDFQRMSKTEAMARAIVASFGGNYDLLSRSARITWREAAIAAESARQCWDDMRGRCHR